MATAKKNEKMRIPGQKPLMKPITSAGRKYETKVMEWAGLNMRNIIDSGELSYTKNMSSDELPYLVPRKSRETIISNISNPRGLFATEDYLLYVGCPSGVDTLYVYDGSTTETFTLENYTTETIRCMVDFNGKVLIFPDKKYLDYMADPMDFGDIATCPDIDYACVYNNRVFGVKGDEVFATVLGQFDDWETLSTPLQPTDSWAADVASKGDFMGIANFNNHVTMFKPEFLHQQYGVKPPYRIQDLYAVGTIDNRSIKEAGNKLFFADDKMVYGFGGGDPRPVSMKLNKGFQEARAGSDGRRYYISAYDGDSWNLYVYDTYFNTWMREDDLRVTDFAYWKKHVYALASPLSTGSTANIYKFDSGTESVEWEIITDFNTLNNLNAKYVNEIRLRFGLVGTESMKISIAYDNDTVFRTVKEFNDSSDFETYGDVSMIDCVIAPREADRFRVKISGVGHTKIYQMVIKTVGGDAYAEQPAATPS